MEYCHDPQLEEEHIDAERYFTLKAYDINEDDRFIVIASDGVWEFLSNE